MHYRWSLTILLLLTPMLVLPFAVWPPNLILLGIAVICYVPAVRYFVTNSKHFEIAQFVSPSGVVVLDLWEIGPDAERFQDFVSRIEAQIREQPTTSPPGN